MVAHSRVIPYVRIYIYLERWTPLDVYTRSGGLRNSVGILARAI